MQMIRAIIRPEKVDEVVDELDSNGFPAFTKIDVFGRGKQKGIRIGPVVYDELAKVMLMIAVDDEDVGAVIKIIEDYARTGSFGDGKIFVSPIDEAYTIRTGERGI
ncbi:MAG: Nitrogen fixation nifHD region glnB-like protein1 [Candidatus Argoarchaeum ethanivorans]|uniref:Nitrogen fixation nifHD region glnB-like protein1 n=1 Tax=Candidatus Argoarchaeum ethanivorans TaxID=2608793 RepID=A0A811TAN8_9EURY|nr:MAG: Nitrogen fixation nifHD region glnB-like protein1 [Candidatus Argoarchaeum ethanivorans]